MSAHEGALDTEGLHQDRPEAISTWSGRYIEPLHPQPEEVCIEDIAHALSRLCRYNGHVQHFLSVARHSIWVAEHVYTLTGDPKLGLQGLLHDGAEAYLSDVPRPVKRSEEMAHFRAIDQRMDEVVMQAFGLEFPIPEVVMQADRDVLLKVELPSPAGARHTWSSTPQEDEHDFLQKYHYLTDKIELVGSERARPTLIGLAGYARAGKDTAFHELGRYGYKRLAFADYLKTIALLIDPLVQIKCEAASLPGINDRDLCCDIRRVSELVELGADEDWLKENTDYRVFLQGLGNSVREVLGKTTWIDAALAQRAPELSYAVTDVRYRNEIDAIHEAGGEVWWIDRPGTGPANEHVSENEIGMQDCDTVVVNDLDIPALKHKVGRTLEAL